MEPIHAVFAIVAFFRAGDHKAGFAALLRLLASIIESLPDAEAGVVSGQLAAAFSQGFSAGAEAKSGDDLCRELEEACGKDAGEGLKAVDWPSLIPVVLPLLFELLKKIIDKILNPTPPPAE